MPHSNIAVVLTTVSTQEQANNLAQQLLNERLIACSTVIPAVTSHYWWEGKITSETETVLLIKTREDCIEQLKKRILELHPYNVPEFIVLKASAVADAYAAWIEEVTTAQKN
ncbi:MAG: divalent-cation tolerance protein CutA [Bacteroidota bacterium]|nr:divalent-cation tolerance protein CutA [Candidatus Kapabacteria bacterium]MDW8075567.1 divalent-cation tolerance protein CutA [Bacteroidota bacterium]MDW8271754.1 divalent-cation tolerance protein CutA [Bacteroidota bacterium]